MLVLRGSFLRIEHVFLLGTVFATYVASGFLAHPAWGTVNPRLAVPSMPLTRAAVVVAAGTIGTTPAPLGVSLHTVLRRRQARRCARASLRADRRRHGRGDDRRDRRFVVVACAATLFATGRKIEDARDAALALAPLAGGFASTLFAIGLVVAFGAGFVLVPGIPLIGIQRSSLSPWSRLRSSRSCRASSRLTSASSDRRRVRLAPGRR
jgi:Mn2+/Fe2+ NRAMP family transporter